MVQLISDGRIQEALANLNEFFPSYLFDPELEGFHQNFSMDIDMQNGKSIDQKDGLFLYFKLLCQQFIELIRDSQPNEALEFVEKRMAPLAAKYPVLSSALQVKN